jgi:16S rRNA (guanine527-N7)-methyltransferase
VSQGLQAITDKAAREKLGRYLDCLAEWSRRINLTGAGTRETAFDLLVRPVLGAEGYLQGPVLDVGSGNGSPALILAALRPDLGFILLEPRAKRWAFLREAVRAMAIGNVEVRRERSDNYTGEPAQTVTMRAVGLAPETLRPILRPGGCVLVFGGPPLDGAETIQLPAPATLQRRCFT